MFTFMNFLPNEGLNGRPIDPSAPTNLISYLLDRGIPCNHISLLITSPSSTNLETRFLLREESCNTHVMFSHNYFH
jgi:hypothetical protein